MNALLEIIARSIPYVQSPREAWFQLERRFCLTNGSRKYSLNRAVDSMKQDGMTIFEYHTRMKCVCKELDSIVDLPQVISINNEIAVSIRALVKQQEQQKLFQFLNGSDEKYSSQRSQMLLLTPLPSVDMACGMLQQDKMQRGVLDG